MKTTPFWHEAAPPEGLSGREPPEQADVAIAGAGFTGLSAALALAEAGRSVAVFDAGAPGDGASTRNGGMVGWGHRATVAGLARRYGEPVARAILAEARLSLEFTTGLVERLPGGTLLRRTGRFLGAGSARHFDALARWAAEEPAALGMEVDVVPPGGQRAHIATDAYSGGLFFPQHGGLHPGLFHRALLAAAREAGAVVAGHCPATARSGEPGNRRRGAGRGETTAREVIWAGNGYTGGGQGPFRPMARRLMPIPSTIIATEELGEARLRELIPRGSMIVDTRSVHSYFRPDPEEKRILWGGRASLTVLPEEESARRLREHMLSVFPALAEARITHSWKGFVAFTFDGVPHIGQLDGVWHACGYNGSGVAMAPYLGWRLAQRVLGTDRGATGFDPAPFRAQRFYGGNPWFLQLVELWYRLKDRREGVRPIRRR